MNTFSKICPDGDDTLIIGAGGDAPDFLINHQLPEITHCDDGLLADINVLIAQNPGHFNFRAPDLSNLNDKAKRQLLIDLQEAMGIGPLEQLMP